jgi:hypothetical protein
MQDMMDLKPLEKALGSDSPEALAEAWGQRDVNQCIAWAYGDGCVYRGIWLIWICCVRNAPKCTRWALKNGANPNVTTAYGSCMLHITVSCSYTAITRLLLEYGANPNVLEPKLLLSPLARTPDTADGYEIAILLYEYGCADRSVVCKSVANAWRHIYKRTRHCMRSVLSFVMYARKWGMSKDLRVAICKIAWAARRDKASLF